MKKIFIVLFFVVLTFCGSVAICAHPGRTDKNGGHTDKSTGTYHYHHGYEAHLHIGGICPYEFDDKTGERSGGTGNSNSSGGSVTYKAETTPIPSSLSSSYTKSEKHQKQNDNSDDGYKEVLIFGFGLLLLIFVFAAAMEYLPGLIEKNKKRKQDKPEGLCWTPVIDRKCEEFIEKKEEEQNHPPKIEPPLKRNANKAFPPFARDRWDRCWALVYQNEYELCLYGSSVDKVRGKEGLVIGFRQEPENTYDRRAIAVYLGRERIGYFYRGHGQDITNRWINSGNKTAGFISSVDTPYGCARFKIAYYTQVPYIPNDFIE